jgi:tRNA (guanine37-N1)-methyltransferase
MRFDIVTIFPALFEPMLSVGVVGRAIGRGTIVVKVHDLRTFTTDRHRVVDDVPYGGGPGMVLKAEPIFRALDALATEAVTRPYVVLTSPRGVRLTQQLAASLSLETHVVLLCGRYEGVDDRVRARVDQEISIGDYVLSGGELPSLVILDAVARHVPGVVGDEESVSDDSFSRGLLEHPQYTRPADLGGADASLKVPDVLLSGHHAQIRRWRKRQALCRTLAERPDLLESAKLDKEERHILQELTETVKELGATGEDRRMKE